MSHVTRPLFECWQQLTGELQAAARIVLFLDFDGTLVHFEMHPDAVQVPPTTREVLAALAASPRFRIYIVSARRRADLLAKVQVPGVRCLGLYGRESSGEIQLE